ncbi:MAG: hypothetical protein JWP89_2177 [Schlesneria sp.]|nr:hypothetical protein [Schlesneria sp.]
MKSALRASLPRGCFHPLLVLCVALTVAITAKSGIAQTRAAVPSAAKQKELAKLLEDGYSLPRLDSTAKKQDAFAKLMESLTDESMGADERYVVLTTAISLASQTGDADDWLKAVNALVATFDVDTTKEKTRLLTEFLKASKPGAQIKPIAEEAMEMSQAAAAEHQFTEALSILSAVDPVLRRAADGAALKPVIAELRTAILSSEKQWKAYQSAVTVLATKPGDPAANLAVGRWHLAESGDWEKALPFILKGGDQKWKAAAELEQSNPTDAMARVAIGDAWWEIAQKETGSLKTAILAHTGRWYELALPDLTSALKKQQLAKRLEEISASQNDAATRQSPKQWIDLLEWAEGVDWAPRGINWNEHVVGKPGKDGITLRSPNWSCFPLPAIIDGDYEMEVEFKRVSGLETVGVYFPVGTKTLIFRVSHGGAYSGVGFVDGKMFRERSEEVSNNQLHRIVIRVKHDDQKASFEIDWNDAKNYIRWEGSPTSLSNSDNYTTTVLHPWIAGWRNQVVFQKMQVRMTSGTIRRDVFTNTDREQDLKNGFVRLTGEKASGISTGAWRFVVNQLPANDMTSGDVPYVWPMITRDFKPCDDYYGAHAPSRLKCPIPPGAKSFSVVGSNHASRSSKYVILIDGKQVQESGVTSIAVMKVNIPEKASQLELVADPAGSPNFENTYWCFPRFHAVAADRLTDKMLDGKHGPLKFNIASGTVASGEMSHNQPIEKSLSTPIHFRDAQPCDEFLFGHAPSVVTYQVPPGMTRFTAIGYDVMSDSVKYEVWADGNRIYESPQVGIVSIDVKLPPGAKTIDLKVNPLGNYAGDYSMWCYPRLYRK